LNETEIAALGRALRHAEMTQTELRGILGQFLFTGDQVFKPVEVLSGGEKSKLALAKLLISGPNILLLDEPTNHMDLAAKEVLEEAFLNYDGSVLCISHDRHFIETLATDIWEIYEGGLIQYHGGYEYYHEKRDEFRERHRQQQKKQQAEDRQIIENIAQKGKTTTPLKQKQVLQKQLNKVEKAVIAVEATINELDKELINPAFQNDYKKLHELGEELAKQQGLLAALNQEWEILAKETL
jgi:ATP-binding cassette subfamily F protein 3